MRLSTSLAGALLVMLIAGAAAAGTQFNPAMPGLFGLVSEYIRCGDPPDGALLAFDVMDEAEFLELLDPGAAEAPTK
ncbi:hypothetical protein [Belnapia rosea]|uniref:Uncharacterized protein n=1 Tax=Belnapia rosea TaxID=938405 RepID=A0A1G6U9A1_9PROT|nr:hypothetical protein [Belnapia rosea]SDB07653.1 hypothetical protein SAMN02927895_00103 [Belnapia rosea]SDD37804.1 hypothetical protein SAMN04487779_100788 [Belnapia rosea]